LADLILFDLKIADSERHREFTGAPNRNILENLAALTRSHSNVIVRVPVVPGVNERSEDIADLSAVLAQLRVNRVELMPYHRAGIEKYRRLGRSYRLSEALPPTEIQMTRVAARLEAAGVAVTRPAPAAREE
jgi:pyruvate formate lyase activating enzyme